MPLNTIPFFSSRDQYADIVPVLYFANLERDSSLKYNSTFEDAVENRTPVINTNKNFERILPEPKKIRNTTIKLVLN